MVTFLEAVALGLEKMDRVSLICDDENHRRKVT